MNNYFGFQANLDKINRQIDELQSLKSQMNQQPMIQQTFMQQGFQSDFDAKWIDNKEQINNITVTRDSIFMDKNNPIFYLKTVSGETKAYDFTEHIELDERDIRINELEAKIKELEKEVNKDAKSVIQNEQQSNKSKSTINAKQI